MNERITYYLYIQQYIIPKQNKYIQEQAPHQLEVLYIYNPTVKHKSNFYSTNGNTDAFSQCTDKKELSYFVCFHNTQTNNELP